MARSEPTGVAYTSARGVGVLTLQRPPANSYDAEVVDALGAAVAEAASGGVVAVIVRSGLDTFFSAGADAREGMTAFLEKREPRFAGA